ncbi:MAG TPA: LacI family DNA-binding transcriptional regulator [Acetobacteraceae bacterium]|nr:LacI family DNA-binding transcriptional regulator [Acetobacteraceae bacterium]
MTITDVAREAGVSTATVDRVINRRAGVRALTRTRVMSAAQRLGYLEPERQADAAPHAPVRLAFVIPGGTNAFLAHLASQLAEAARRRAPEAVVQVHRMEAFDPQGMAEGLCRLAASAQGIGIVGLDHPAMREAIRQAAAAGARVLTLVSDIADVPRVGYVGIDNRAAGRLAGHLLGRFTAGRGGKVALLAGSLSYRGHEEREMGFRGILAEEAPGLAVLDSREVRDDSGESHLAAAALLRAHPDLAGIYNIGGGNRGIVRALEEAGRIGRVVLIGHELTEYTRRFLLSGAMEAVIDQAPRQEAELAIDRLIEAVRAEAMALRIPLVRTQVIFRENMPEA